MSIVVFSYLILLTYITSKSFYATITTLCHLSILKNTLLQFSELPKFSWGFHPIVSSCLSWFMWHIHWILCPLTELITCASYTIANSSLLNFFRASSPLLTIDDNPHICPPYTWFRKVLNLLSVYLIFGLIIATYILLLSFYRYQFWIRFVP